MIPTIERAHCVILHRHGMSDQDIARHCHVRTETIFKVRKGLKTDYKIAEKTKPLIRSIWGWLSQEEVGVMEEIAQYEDTIPPDITPEQVIQGILDRFHDIPDNDYEWWARERGTCTLKACEERSDRLVLSQIEGKIVLLCPVHHHRYQHLATENHSIALGQSPYI